MSRCSELVQVWVVQDTHSGAFLTQSLGYTRSLREAGRLYDAMEAKDTAITQFGPDYEIHTFWEPEC